MLVALHEQPSWVVTTMVAVEAEAGTVLAVGVIEYEHSVSLACRPVISSDGEHDPFSPRSAIVSPPSRYDSPNQTSGNASNSRTTEAPASRSRAGRPSPHAADTIPTSAIPTITNGKVARICGVNAVSAPPSMGRSHQRHLPA